MAVGRISGPLLKANLLRNGVDLAFETDLLYLDVVNGMVGIKTATPGYDLDVNGTTRTTDATITNQLDVATFTVSGNTIASSDPTINLTPSGADPVVYQGKLEIHDISISNNTIEVTATGQNLEFTTQGTGQVVVNSNMLVNGDLHATGTITADGNINIGNANTDNVVFNADINSNIIPNINAYYDLGSASQRWNTAYAQTIVASSVVSDNIVANGVELTTTPGKTYFVATNGLDTNAGNHPQSCFASISKAVTVATAGDTVVIYPGVYEETFPIEVPPGVTIHGTSIRSVTIKPTASTMYFDAFHMNGEATVEDLTLTGFYHDPLGTVPEFPINNQGTGHAFRFSWGCLTQKRSPYIRNVTVITQGTASVLAIAGQETQTIDGLNRIKSIIDNLVINDVITKTPSNTQSQVIDPLVVSNSATGTLLQGLIDDIIHIINNGTLKADLPTITANGTAVTSGVLKNAAIILENNRNFLKEEITAYVTTLHPSPGFVYDIATCQRDMGYILDAMIYDIVRGGNEHTVYAGLAHWVQPTNDPRGYARGDAGHGALVDGGAVDSASKEAAMLFHAVTFLTPAADTLIATNGSRIEWLNSFTYFAGKGLYAYSSPEGYAQAGLTRLRINNRAGTWAVGNTITYYDTDGTTVLATGIVDSISGNYINLTGRCLGFETITDRVGKTASVVGDAKLSTAQKKFGDTSLALDGTGDYISYASQPDFDLGTGDFCFEAWVYPTTTGTYRTLFDLRSSAGDTGGIILGISDINALYFYYNGNYRVGPVGSVAQNAWSHIALARVSGETRAFINGTQVGSTYTDANNYAQRGVRIGADPNGNYAFAGYIDDAKISKGAGRYSSNFTAPIAPLTGDLSTVLLLHFNGSNNSTVILDDGITYQDIRSSAGGTATLINFADYSDFGAEIRSIGSANVYGDYGAYGDGPGVIAYLISQNFAYVGAGNLTTNDPNDRIEANEVVELNGAHIYRTSVDNEGNFQVGNNFYVNQKTGDVYFNNQSLSISAPAGVTFTDGTNSTVILPESITTGNIKISGNTIESLTGDVNVTSASGAINLQNDTYVTGNLDVTGDVTIGGNITIGDASTDTVNFVGQINSNLVPATTNLYDLGTTAKRWNNTYVNKVIVDNLTIDSNTISTTVAGTDLTLTANGTGKISIPSNDVAVTGNMNVNGTTTLTSVGTALTVNGAFNQTGNYNQTGNFAQVGNTDITGNLTVSTWGQFQSIRVDTNEVSVTAANTDLVLKANGTGIISVPVNDVTLGQDLTVTGTAGFGTLNVTGTTTSNAYSTGDILIDDNYITTTITNHNLELRANGTGIISVPTNNVEITNNLTVTTGTTSLQDTTIVGTVTHTGSTTQTGSYTQTGDVDITGNLTVSTWGQFQSIRVDLNEVSVTATNQNLVLKANGTGIVSVPTNDVTLGQNLTVTGTANFGTLGVTGTITTNAITTGDILIDDNYITTTITNHNLELRANGTGIISVPTNNVEITNNLTVTTGTTSLKDTTIVGTITQTGSTTQTGSYTQTGDVDITGTLTVSSTAQFENIKINSNVIETTLTNTNLQLEAAGTGKVYVPLDDVLFGQNLTVDGTASFGDLSVTGTITTNAITTGDILIDDNYITTTITNHNLELRANGTGKIVIPTNDVDITNNLTVNGTTSLNKDPLAGNALEITGSLLQVGDVTQTGTTTQYGDSTIYGSLNATIGQFEKIRVASTTISTTTANTDLVLKANGTGIISIPSNNVQFDQDLTVNGVTTLNSVTVTNGINANSFTTGDILVDDNYITTTITNHDLELSADGTGQVVVPSNNVLLQQDLTVQGSLTVTTGTTTFNDLTVNGTITQTGDYTQTGNFTTTGNTEVTGNITGTGYLQLPQLKFENNTISAITTNTNINLVVNGTGSVVAEDLAIRSNEIRSLTTNSNITLTPQGTGQVIINSNQSLILPAGDNSTRPTSPSVGAVRYNTQLSRYEGWNGSYWITLGGVQDVDGNTKITAELTPGANDNTIRFYVNGTLMSYIDATKWYSERIETSNLAIYDNNITTVSTNTDINLTTTGTGGVRIGNLRIHNNTITNVVSGAITEFVETGTGYVKISGTNGFVIPSGDTVNDRPQVTETGMLRFNTQLNVVEIFDGVVWTSVAGATGGVSYAEATDIALAIVLSLG